jgi:hypothetical protein
VNPALSACQRLAEITIQTAESQKDALSAFMEVHLCICEGVEKESTQLDSLSLKELSEKFTERFIGARSGYFSRVPGHPPAVHPAWKTAFSVYDSEPTNYLKAMAFIAAAHIGVDLFETLCEMQREVSFKEYHVVDAYISRCLDEIGSRYAGADRIAQEVWKKVHYLLGPVAGATILGRWIVYELAQRERLQR